MGYVNGVDRSSAGDAVARVRNVDGFIGAGGKFHPIRSSSGYDPSEVDEPEHWTGIKGQGGRVVRGSGRKKTAGKARSAGSGRRRNPAGRTMKSKSTTAAKPRHGVYVSGSLAYVGRLKSEANKAATALKRAGKTGITQRAVGPNPVSGKVPVLGWRAAYKGVARAGASKARKANPSTLYPWKAVKLDSSPKGGMPEYKLVNIVTGKTGTTTYYGKASAKKAVDKFNQVWHVSGARKANPSPRRRASGNFEYRGYRVTRHSADSYDPYSKSYRYDVQGLRGGFTSKKAAVDAIEADIAAKYYEKYPENRRNPSPSRRASGFYRVQFSGPGGKTAGLIVSTDKYPRGKTSITEYSRLFPASEFRKMTKIHLGKVFPTWEQAFESRENPSPGRRASNPGGVDNQAAQELYLYIKNDGQLYRQRHAPIIANLQKKLKAGRYNSALAVKGMRYLVDDGAKAYAKEFATASQWSSMFNVPTRNQVAREFVDDFEGEYGKANPSKRNPRKSASTSRAPARKRYVVYVGKSVAWVGKTAALAKKAIGKLQDAGKTGVTGYEAKVGPTIKDGWRANFRSAAGVGTKRNPSRSPLLFRMVKSPADWRRLITKRVLSGWYLDPDLRKKATAAEVDSAEDDIYTDWGWNTEPQEYPALVHIRAGAKRNPNFPGRLGSGQRFSACVETMSRRPGVDDPAGLCAAIGRRKYGAKGMARLAAGGRRRNSLFGGGSGFQYFIKEGRSFRSLGEVSDSRALSSAESAARSAGKSVGVYRAKVGSGGKLGRKALWKRVSG